MSTQRVITVISTQGKQKVKLTTDVKTWGELKPMLTKEGYDLSRLLATESIGRHDLINEQAALAEQDFTVFLRPAKTKSGADVADMDYKELRAAIKSEIEKGGDAAKEHFNVGKSYTNKTTDALRELLHDWFASSDDNAAQSVSDVLSNENMSDEEKLDLIRQLAEEINKSGKYTVTIESVENVDEDAAETEALLKEAEEILAGYKVTIYLKA